MKVTVPPDELLTATQVAKVLAVTPTTAGRYGATGRLPSVRTPGGHRRYPREAILAVLATPGPILDTRRDLTGHTITVEYIDDASARDLGIRDGSRLLVVERTDGRLGKVCLRYAQLAVDETMSQHAEAFARAYGARYVPLGGAA